RSTRAHSRELSRGIGRPRGTRLANLLQRRATARPARARRRFNLQLLAHARGLHHSLARGRRRLELHRERRVRERRREREHPVRGGVRDSARADHGGVLDHGAPIGRVRGAVMETRATRLSLRIWTTLVLAFLWIPLVLMAIYAFNKSVVQSWPIPGWTTHWFSVAWHNPDARSALWLSVKVGLVATGVAIVLGSMAAFAIHRFRFFGRESVSFLLLLPIALPGIITGMALNSFYVFAGVV